MWTSIRLDLVDGIWRGMVVAIATLTVFCPNRLETARVHLPEISIPQRADFGSAQPSSDTRQVVNWVIRSHDNQQLAFVVIDKRASQLYVFDDRARFRGATTILLGAARGDDTVAGIGQRPIADVRPEERTTPAGRFLAERGHDSRGEDVVWVDYDAGVSIHRVLTTHPSEHRLARLASSVIADKRISYGCINVPVAFYETQIRPMFARHRAMVYVLPEVKTIQQVFNLSDAGPR